MIMMGGEPGAPAGDGGGNWPPDAVLRDPPQRHRLRARLLPAAAGRPRFRACVAEFLSAQYGWKLGAGNIKCYLNGSQRRPSSRCSTCWAGELPDGGRRTIHLPLTPLEYPVTPTAA
jgi:hypothetical protein